jgi:protein-tyrosine phosphatase
MIDFHSHILPALDDGAVTIDDSIAMARELAAFGFKTVCCTPHCIKGYYDLTPQKVREATLMLQADLDNADIRLELWPGMEYMLDEFFSEFVDILQPLGDTRLVLCEAPPKAHPGVVRDGLELIIKQGFVPLIAHPERTKHFYEILTQREAPSENSDQALSFEGHDAPHKGAKPKSFLKRWFAPRTSGFTPRKDSVSTTASRKPELPGGVAFQANLGSFTGYYGESVQRKAYELLKLGAYTALASDLHDGSGTDRILDRDKIDTNPLLQKIAAFNGSTSGFFTASGRDGGGGQGELF